MLNYYFLNQKFNRLNTLIESFVTLDVLILSLLIIV